MDPLQFSAPRGLFVLGVVGDEPVAMGGWTAPEDGSGTRTAKIRRMFVAATARRQDRVSGMSWACRRRSASGRYARAGADGRSGI